MMNKVLQKAGKELRVITVEAQEAVWQLAPRDWIGKRKAAIAGVSRRLGWTFARTWNIAHGRARRIDAEEMDRLRAELGRLEALKEQENGNRERHNALVFARHEIGRAIEAHREGGSGEGPLPQAARSSREAGRGAGPRAAAKTSTRG
jgi:hypothetical protein